MDINISYTSLFICYIYKHLNCIKSIVWIPTHTIHVRMNKFYLKTYKENQNDRIDYYQVVAIHNQLHYYVVYLYLIPYTFYPLGISPLQKC